jgi:NADPH:quinone reductase
MDWQSTRVWRVLLPVVNRLMRYWLRSRWHRMVSLSMMVLTFEGVRSGRVYSFPVGYVEDAEGLVTFTPFAWWKNFREGRPVSLRLRGREVRETAFAVRNQEQVAERFAYYLRRNPHDGR